MAIRSDDDGAWHLDRKVPLALIFAILVQTAMGFWRTYIPDNGPIDV